MKESEIERHVCAYARNKGWRNMKLNGPGERGKPDRLFYAPGGRVIFVEFKKPGGQVAQIQYYRLAELAKCDFDTYVVETKEEGEALFNAHA